MRDTRAFLLLLFLSPAVPGIAGQAVAYSAIGPSTLVAFVTSTSGNGELGTWTEVLGEGFLGVEAGDEICQIRAEAGGLATAGVPEFVAWLSDSSTDAYCHVQGLTGTKAGGCGGGLLPGAGPWMRVDGLPWAADLDTLTGPQPGNGPFVQMDRDEANQFVNEKTYITGTSDSGVLSASHSCGDWLDSNALYAGSITDAVNSWSGGATSNCGSTTFRLLCLETGTGVAAEPPSGPGALAFVTSTYCTGDFGACSAEDGDAGRDAADNVCIARARAGRLPDPESFYAWISTTGANAGDRLAGPGPWRRPDGYLIANDAADWKDGYINAVLFRDELGGEQINKSVWTGTSLSGNATGTDCTGWTTDVSGTATVGRPDRGAGRWTSAPPVSCSTEQSLYCLSNEVVLFWNDFEPGGYDRDWSDTVGLP